MVELPNELWRTIISLATCSSSTRDLCEKQYIPFSNQCEYWGVHTKYFESLEATFSMKRQIVLVCKLWAAIGAEFLYEDIRIRHGASELVRSLVQNGGYVRRIQLSITKTNLIHDRANPIRLVDILRLCPRLQEFVKLRGFGEFFQTSGFWNTFWQIPLESSSDGPIALKSLIRFEWANESPSLRLRALLPALSNVSPLQLYIQPHPKQAALSLSTTWLSSITTLRVASLSMANYAENASNFPNLVHLIADVKYLVSSDLLHKIGKQLVSLELESSGPIFGSYDLFADILQPCPNLETISFLLRCPMFEQEAFPPLFRYPALKKVHIGSSILTKEELMNFMYQHAKDARPDQWGIHNVTLVEHLTKFLKLGVFPSFKQVVLHGNWTWLHNMQYQVVHAGPIFDLFEQFLALGISVEVENGRVLTLGEKQARTDSRVKTPGFKPGG